MKIYFNILSLCTIFLSFVVYQAFGSDLDQVICNAMKGMQVKEEKKKEQAYGLPFSKLLNF